MMHAITPRAGQEARVAYFAQVFPSIIESYVWLEIDALRARGIAVHTFAAKQPPEMEFTAGLADHRQSCTFLTPLRAKDLLAALGLCWRRRGDLAPIVRRVLFGGREGIVRRMKALLHIVIAAHFARLAGARGITHIHAHHGYFAAWAAMVAGRLLGIPYSITLHGSDLLVDQIYLDLKVRHAAFVMTISDYNKRFLQKLLPGTPGDKIIVRRIGTEIAADGPRFDFSSTGRGRFIMLIVGRLVPVKNHEFLLDACARLKRDGAGFLCLVVGGGPERAKLERRIVELGLTRDVKLLDMMDRLYVEAFYDMADLVVLTSKSEGIPAVLMEAMLHEKPVLAPSITGIPELVEDGRTGFLYAAGDLDGFVATLRRLMANRDELSAVGRAARERVTAQYDRGRNLEQFCEFMAGFVAGRAGVK